MTDLIHLFPFDQAPVMRDLGAGDDRAIVHGPKGGQVRLSFTSAEVGNGNSLDAGLLAGQDGGLALRLQAEDATGALTGPITRLDDEGIRFEARGGITFDVRDLVSGAARGSLFQTVQLGTDMGDVLDFNGAFKPVYVNAGRGDDVVTGGKANDFLVGGAGHDMLYGGRGEDSFIGGAGNDMVLGGDGADLFTFAPLTDGMDSVDLGAGRDTVMVTAAAGTQVRLSFTSAEVGNGRALDGGTLAGQDGGLALRLAQEDAAGTPMATAGRFDDEGIRFMASAGVTFDVRDLVSGAARGDQFAGVILGTEAGDRFLETASTAQLYVNAGAGNDTIRTGAGADFLVGGLGDDVIDGGLGDDMGLGGAGNDTLFLSLDAGADRFDLGDGADIARISAPAGGQVRVSFTSSEVGNGRAQDGGTLAGQDGGLALRLAQEDAAGAVTGPVSRLDDEGIRLVASVGVTFDVRDLVSGAQRGDQFALVQLGTLGADRIDETTTGGSIYVNAGQGDDWVMGGKRSDFLVGGAGADSLMGGRGADTLLGGAGNDSLAGGEGADVFLFTGSDGMDLVADFASGLDMIDLRSLGAVGLMQTVTTEGLRLEIDRTADGVADLTILLEGVTSLRAGDIWM